MKIIEKHVVFEHGSEYYQYNFEVLMTTYVNLDVEQYSNIVAMIEEKLEEYESLNKAH